MATPTPVPAAAPRRDRPAVADLERELDVHRAALTGYCYRMLGSPFDAEDAVQETMVRAWRALDRFEGRAALRTWLFGIATNVCIDMSNAGRRRALPMDLSSPASANSPAGERRTDLPWVGPALDARVGVDAADPAEATIARDSVRVAFVAALQHLPARQRAVLILRDVLRWRAGEVATLLDMTTTAVNSMLRRARSALGDAHAGRSVPLLPPDEARAVVDRYVDAFERLDMDLLVRLLRDDATLDMPPHLLWLDGPEAIAGWFREQLDPCNDHVFRPLAVNGTPGLAMYRPAAPGAVPEPFGVQVIEVAEGGVMAVHTFLDPALFPLFGLPATASG